MIYNHHNHHDCFNSSRHREETQCLDNNLMFVSIIHISISIACMYLSMRISFYLSYIYLLTWALYTLSMCISFYLSCTYSGHIPTYLMHVSINFYLFYLYHIHNYTYPAHISMYICIHPFIHPTIIRQLVKTT